MFPVVSESRIKRFSSGFVSETISSLRLVSCTYLTLAANFKLNQTNQREDDRTAKEGQLKPIEDNEKNHCPFFGKKNGSKRSQKFWFCGFLPVGYLKQTSSYNDSS